MQASPGLQYHAYHDGAATPADAAVAKMMPGLEIRFKNLSLSTPLTVTTADSDKTHELPTIYNDLKNALKPSKTTTQITKNILNNVSGVFKPASMTLVLGQPGAGKSALLRILAGRLPLSKTLTLDGDITYNGLTRDQLLQTKRMPHFVSYIAQTDQHFPTLTVKETLHFAQHCCGAGVNGQGEADQVIKQLGLELCQDTVIGDGMLRGVSGGERKRVTLGEMELGNNLVSLMDEISTGLDSAATFDIVSAQRRLAKTHHKTIVMALLQPGPEVFELFDDVMLLAEGHVLYHGPRDQVVGYFQSLGLECPRNRDVADFLIDIGTPKQTQYVRTATSESNTYAECSMTPAELAATFRESSIFDSMLSQLDLPVPRAVIDDFEDRLTTTPEFHEPFWPEMLSLLQREFRKTWRNKKYVRGRFGMLVVIALIDSTLFFNLDLKNVQSVLGAIIGVILYAILTQPAMAPLFVSSRTIFYKQRDANFHRTSSYVTAVAINQMSLSLLEAFLYIAIVYWGFGLVGGISSFVGFSVVLFLMSVVFTSSTFFFTCLCETAPMAGNWCLVISLMYTLFAGIFIPRTNIAPYLIWIYWVNPMAWALRAISVQQYTDDQVNKCVYDGIDYCKLYGKPMGTYSLESFDIFPAYYWFWAGLGFLVAMPTCFYVGSVFVLERKRHETACDHEVSVKFESDGGVPTSAGDTDLSADSGIPTTPDAVHIAVLTPRATRHITGVTLAFEEIRYSVPDPNNKGEHLQLLKGISGFAKPGTITALMGSTGAGKTTLMDVIAGRKTGGTIHGRILLNGYEASDQAIRRSTGYCEQMSDNHSEAATVREALTFSAFLRQSADVPDAEKLDAVEECLDLLNLRPIADKILRGSSLEQMKRVAIGVELAAHTSVLFLDEPTSGLDARAAKLVMDAVRKVADSGRTVVYTIHQPSWEVVQDFDSLLLLKRGGEVVFFGEFGPNACEVIQYFESIDGVTPMEKGSNPATWMLDVIGAGIENANETTADFVSIFQASEKKRMLDRQLNEDGVTRPKAGVPAVAFATSHAASHFVQAKLLFIRCARSYWRTSEYNITRVATAFALALVFGFAFGKTEFDTFKGLYTVVTMVGVSMVFVGAISFDGIITFTIANRASFYREQASHTYNSFWYCMASTIVEIPYVFAKALIFSAAFFPLAGFTGVMHFILFWVHFSLYLLLQTYIGQVLSFAAPSFEVATTWGLLITTISFLFMGFNPARSDIPSGYKWLHAIVPPKYTMAILTSVVAGECNDSSSHDVGCLKMRDAPPTLPANITNAEYLDVVFNIRRYELWINFSVILSYLVLTRVLALVALRFVKQGKR